MSMIFINFASFFEGGPLKTLKLRNINTFYSIKL